MTVERSFPAHVNSIAAARSFVTDELQDCGATTIEAAKIIVSEFATNAVTHARTGFQVRLSSSREHLRIDVTDTGSGMPVLRPSSPQASGGRGLRIVEMLAEAWGVETAPASKTVWCTLGFGPGGGSSSVPPTAA